MWNSNRGLSTLILLGLLVTFGLTQSALAQTKIMPLGNSITSGKVGGSTVGGYRDDLANKLDTEGVSYDFVGSMSDGTGFDTDHEGHDGENAAYLSSHIESWLNAANPEIVLLHIGTNDIQGQEAPEDIVDNINSIIEKVHSYDSNVGMVVSSVIPRKDEYDTQTTVLNDLILESYYSYLSAGYTIYYAGHNEVFKSTTNWETELMASDDDIHPNDQGYAKMAEVFYTAIMKHLSAGGDQVTDNFNRLQLGSDWVTLPDIQIVANELSNTSTNEIWDNFIAAYAAQSNPTQVSFVWGSSADAAGINEGGFALMLDDAAYDANGYFLRIRSDGYINLWTIVNGIPSDEIDLIAGSLPQPGAGDEFKVVLRTDGAGHHFKCFINGNETGEVSDPENNQGNGSRLYAGVMLKGNRNNNIDDFNLFKKGDTEAPAAITDLEIISQSTSSIMLQWTAPGDDGSEGLVSEYEIRYSKANITESNFAEADLASANPVPVSPGSQQTAVVAGLESNTSYFFAVKAKDEVPNSSAMSNITSGTTLTALYFTDYFERESIGDNWTVDPVFSIVSGQLANSSGGSQWDYIAAYTAKKNPVEAKFQWASSATDEGIARGAMVFLDSPSPTANGYMVWLRKPDNKISLWTIANGMPQESRAQITWNGGYVNSGDFLKVVFSRDEDGKHFDVYKNSTYLSRLTDYETQPLSEGDYWAGVMLHGNLDNNIEEFSVAIEVGEPSVLEYVSGDNGSGVVNQQNAEPLVVRITDKNGNPIQGVAVSYDIIAGSGALDVQSSPDNNIRIQAERGVLSGEMQIFNDDSDASGGKYIKPPGGDPGEGRALYQVYIKDPGEYVVWGRVHAPTADNNSFFFIMDDGEKLTWDLNFREDTWYWDRVSDRGDGTEGRPETDPVKFDLTAGLHTFIIEEREYNSKIDHIILTKDTEFTPEGKEEYDEYATDENGLASAVYTYGTKAGTETVQAAVPGLTGSPVTFNLTALPASPDSLIAFSGNNQTGVGGEQLAEPFVVKVTDLFGNPVASVPVKFQTIQGGGVFTETSPLMTNDSGKVTIHYTLGTTAFENQVKVTSTSVPDVELIFKATLSGGIAAKLSGISGNNQKGVVNSKLANPFVVMVSTDDDEAVKNHLVTFKITKGQGTFDGASLQETGIRTGENGLASVFLYLGTSTDTSVVTANAQGPDGDLVGAPVTFKAIPQPDVPGKMVYVSGNNLTGAAGSPLREPFVVMVTDQYSNPISGHAVAFNVTAGEGNIDGASSKVAYTESNGEASVYLVLGSESNVENKVQAVAKYDEQNLQGSPYTFTATSGKVTAIEYVSGNQQNGSAGHLLANSFEVKIVDNFGNPVPQYQVDFVVTQGSAHFYGTNDTTVSTNFDGIASLKMTLGNQPGSTFTAEARGYLFGVPLNGNPIKFTATSAGLKTLKYVSGNDQTGKAAQILPEPLKVQILDTAGKGIPGTTVKFEVTSGGGSFAGVRQKEVTTLENGFAEIELTLGPAPGDSNNVVSATATYNDAALEGSPVKFYASATIGAAAEMQVQNNYLTGVVGNALEEAFKIKIVDLGGNPVQGQSVKFEVSAGDGKFDESSTKTVVSNEQGIAQAILTLGPVAGDTNNVVNVSSLLDGKHLTGSPATLKASARTSAAATLALVSGNNQSGTAGKALAAPLKVKVTDNSGNGVEGHPVTFRVKTGSGKLGEAEESSKVVSTNSEGIAEVSYILSASVSENNEVEAISTNGDNPLNGSPLLFTATGAAGPVSVTQSKVTASSTEVVADGLHACSVSVLLVDEFNNPIKEKQVEITVSGTENVINPSQATSNEQGIAEFTIKTIRAGLKQVTALDVTDDITIENKASVRFTAQAAAKIVYHAGNAQVANVGTATPEPLQVMVTDINDNPVDEYSVEYKITGGSGHLYNLQPTSTDTNGIANGILVVGTDAGVANTVEAYALGLSGSPVSFMASGVSGTASAIEIVGGNEQNAMSGTVLPLPLEVRVIDDEGLAIWDYSVTFQVELGNGSFDGVQTKTINTDEFGKASLQFQLADELGLNIVKAQAEGLSGSPLSFVEHGTAGKASMIRMVSGDEQSASIGGSLPLPLIVKVTDYNGNGVEGQEVTFNVTQGDASMIEEQPLVTDLQGIVEAKVQLGSQSGKIIIEAVAPNLVYSPIKFTASAMPHSAAKMEVADGNNQTGTVGRELVYPFKVLVTDEYDNPVSGVDITFAIVEGSGKLLDGQVAISDSNGVAQNHFQLDSTPGPNRVYALKTGLQNSPLTFSATGVTNKFPIIEELSDVTIDENQTLRFTVKASDDDGETVTYGAFYLPEGAAFDSTGSHEFIWTPDLTQAGKHTVRFMAYDPRNGFDAEDITITVNNVNRAPKIIGKYPSSIDVYAPKHDTLKFQIIVSDADSDPIQYKWYQTYKGKEFLVSTQNMYAFASDEYPAGSYTIRVSAFDGTDSVTTQWDMMWTSIQLSGFSAVITEHKNVRLYWETSVESNNAGFNVLRSYSEDGTYRQINKAPLSSNLNGQYVFIDSNVEAGRTYFYRLEDIDLSGERTLHDPISITMERPLSFELTQNYPNPFNPVTHIRYQLPETGVVQLSVYNLLGQEIKTLVAEKQIAGFYVVRWDGTDNNGFSVASGIYLYHLQTGDFRQTRRMVLLK